MKKTILVLLGSIITVAAAASLSFAQAEVGLYNKPVTELRLAMRKLWSEHVIWTRNYTTSALANLEDANAGAERLLKNQDDIGDAIKPYYGADAGKKLSELLRSHITIATEVVKAAKEGNQGALKAAQDKWHANADSIAAFLSSANPNWTSKGLTDMLYKHLELITAEVTNRLEKDWASDIKSTDENYIHMLMFADTLTDGIVKQFPDKFSK